MITTSIFLVTMFIVPTAFVGINDSGILQSAVMLSQIPHDGRIAIYDESNVTVPAYSNAENLTNHIDEIASLLESAGHNVTSLTTADILNHELLTVDYDVFIMVNNLPRENIIKEVKEFWLGGGSILSFNGVLSYLMYEGFLIDGMPNDGHITQWLYLPSDIQNVTSRHPTMKDYHVNDSVSERAANWMTTSTAVIGGFDINTDTTVMLSNASFPFFVTAFAVNNNNRGGRIVQLPGDGSSIPATFESIITDSVDWLIPKPKGRIVFDLTHQPRLGVDDWDTDFVTIWNNISNFGQFRDLAVNHTYTFDKFYPTPTANLTAARLANYDVLVLPWPDLNYTSSEIAAVEDWVTGGGSIIALGDRHGFPGPNPGDLAINNLLNFLDMNLGTTNIQDYILATPGNHLALEYCTSLSMGYRNHLSVFGNATAVWLEGTDPVVGAQQFGEGRVVLSADMNIFDNGYLSLASNRQFALNTLNWLSATKATTLLFTTWLANFNYAAAALRDLGVRFQLAIENNHLVDFIDSQDWNLIIIDQSNYVFSDSQLDKLYAYVDGGGTLIMSYYGMDDDHTHPLWSKLGVEYSADLSGSPTLYIWDDTHPIFNEPNDHSNANFTADVTFTDDGDSVTALTGFTALAGGTATQQAGHAFIVLGNGGKTLYNSYLIDGLTTDTDDSTYRDCVELWENEISFMMTPHGGGFPFDLITLALIGGAAVALIVVIALVLRHRSSAPAPTPKKKQSKKK